MHFSATKSAFVFKGQFHHFSNIFIKLLLFQNLGGLGTVQKLEAIEIINKEFGAALLYETKERVGRKQCHFILNISKEL